MEGEVDVKIWRWMVVFWRILVEFWCSFGEVSGIKSEKLLEELLPIMIPYQPHHFNEFFILKYKYSFCLMIADNFLSLNTV